MQTPRDQVIEHCAKEAARPDTEVWEEYDRRIGMEIDRVLAAPMGFPEWAEERPPAWVAPTDVFYAPGVEPFFHHDRESLTAYAVHMRGDAEIHLRAMADLHLTEYPAPGGRMLYIVSTNGHHRRLVFAAMGLPLCQANVARSLPGARRTYRDRGRELAFFEFLGLAENITLGEYGEWLFNDPTDYVCWVIPEKGVHSRKGRREIVERTRQLERVCGRGDDPRLEILRSERDLRRQHLRFTIIELLPALKRFLGHAGR